MAEFDPYEAGEKNRKRRMAEMIAPNAYTEKTKSEQANIDRRAKMIELLQGQADAPIERFSYGGIEAYTPPTAYLAKILSGAMAGYQSGKAGREQEALDKYKEQARIQDMANIREAASMPRTSLNLRSGTQATDLTQMNENLLPGMDPFTGSIPARRYTMITPEGSQAMFDLTQADRKAVEDLDMRREESRAKMLAEQFDREEKAQTNDMKNYNYAVEQGYPGKFEQFMIDNRTAGAPENAYSSTVANKAAENDTIQFDTANAAVENIQKLQDTMSHLRTSDAITGIGAEFINNIERMRSLLLNSESAGKRVSDTELLDSMLGSDVFPMIKALGIGSRGLDTPAEREFLRNVMTGTIALNKETLIKMTQMRIDISQRAIDRFNKRVDSGSLDRFFDASGIPRQNIELYPDGGANAQTPTEKTDNITPEETGNLTPAELSELEALRKIIYDAQNLPIRR
jgi:hypothetical protein